MTAGQLAHHCPSTCLSSAFLMLGMFFLKQLPAFREGFQSWQYRKPTLLGKVFRKAPHSLPTSLPKLQTQHFLLSYLPMTSYLDGQSPGNKLG